MSDRRIRILKVSGCFFDELLRAEPHGDALFRGMTSDAPKDLHVVGFFQHRAMDDTFEFVVTSEEFEPLPEGAPIPVIDFTFTSHYEERAA
jgi:hypothetical protein